MSSQRRCDIYKATDGKWYMILGNFEYAEDMNDCTPYGPFTSEQGAVTELDNHSNPGGWMSDDSGKRAPPKGAVRTARPDLIRGANFYRWRR